MKTSHRQSHKRLFCLALLVAFVSANCCLSTGVLHADDALDDYNLAVGLYNASRWTLAADTFRDYLKKHPQHVKVPYARLFLGLTLINLKQYDEARATLRTYVANYPKSRNIAEAMYRVAECSYLLGDVKAAGAELQTFIDHNADSPLCEWALPYLGDIRLRQKQPQQAATLFEQALKKYPESRLADDAKFGLARSYEQLKQSEKAVKLYQELIKSEGSPRAADALINLAGYYFEKQNYAEAAQAYLDLVTKFPESPLASTAQLNAGFAFYQAGDFPQAIAAFEKCKQDKGNFVTGCYWQGVSQKSLKQYDAAVKSLQEAYDHDSQGPMVEEILYQWADTEYRRQEYQKSQKLFLELVDRFPQGKYADNSLHFAAESALLSDHITDAEKLVERFNKEYPNSGLRLSQELLKGRLLDAKGGEENLRTALKHFERVLKESTLAHTQSLARFHVARIQRKLGLHKEVLETVKPLLAEIEQQQEKAEYVDALLLQATSALELKQYATAADAASLFWKYRPDSLLGDQALSTRALAEAFQGNQNPAQHSLTLLTNRYPKSALIPGTVHQMAEAAYEAKNWKWAADLFGQLIALGVDSPYHVTGLAGRGWSRYEDKDYQQAAADFAQLVKDHPKHSLAAEAAYMQGKSLQEGGKNDEAIAAYAQTLKQFGKSRHAFLAGLQAARMTVAAKKLEEADKLYDQLLDQFPQADDADKLLDEWALVNYEAGRFQQSDKVFDRLIKQFPQSDLADNARLSLAESSLISGDVDKAKKSFDELYADARSDDRVKEVALYRLIEISLEKKNYEEVARLAQELLRKYPKSQYAWYVRFSFAEAQMQLDQPEKAIDWLKELQQQQGNEKITNEPWYARTWVLLAEALLRRKDYAAVAAAVADFEKWNPDSPFLYQAYEVLGRSYKNQALFDEARQAFQKVIDSPEGRKTETAAKSQFLIAETYLLQKEHKKALLEYLKVDIQYDFPDWQAPALYQAAMCHEALKETEQARKTYEELVQKYPKSEFVAKAQERIKQLKP